MRGPNGDEFEQRFMRDGSRILHRDKHVSRGMAAMLGVPGLFTIGLSIFVGLTNATADKPLPPVALPFVMAAMVVFGLAFLTMAVAFAVLRVVVTEKEVHVKYGLWGPSISLASVTSVRVIDYQWHKYGGWGIRRGADGSWAYVARSGPVVELCYTEGAETKKLLIGAEDAAGLARAIQEARSKSVTGTRIAVDTGEARAEAEAEAETEAEAEAPRERNARG
jgi:hypothetical protein